MIRVVIYVSCLCLTLGAFAQKTGQNFCEGDLNGTYFPLDIDKKEIVWGRLTYTETKIGTQIFNNKTYQVYQQKWSEGTIDTLYLIEEEEGRIYQYDEILNTTILRLDPSLKKGSKWKPMTGFSKMKVISYDATLNTPFCQYTDLLAIKATYKSGGTYTFYYLKGYGYVGASTKKGVLSYVTPFTKKQS